MSKLSNYLLKHFYTNSSHPYRIFEKKVEELLTHDSTLLDAGCGRGAPVLKGFVGRASRLIGVELVEFTENGASGVEYINADLSNIPLPDASVDLIMSRSVFEHLVDPEAVYRELARLLKPGGRIVFLTANLWDYATIIARLVPNRYHAKIVSITEGRAEEDVFPTAYRTNSQGDIDQLTRSVGLTCEEIRYLGQYPNYFMFNGFLFFLGTCYDKLISRYHFLRFLRGWLLVTLRKSDIK